MKELPAEVAEFLERLGRIAEAEPQGFQRSQSLVAVEVVYPPGAASLPHSHAKSAFIYAYVVAGNIASKVNDEPERIYKVGEAFFEEPGSRHPVSRNASKSEPAKLLAVFVAGASD